MPPMVEMITPCKVSRMNQIIKQWLVLEVHLCTPVMHQTRVCQSQHCFNRFVHFPSSSHCNVTVSTISEMFGSPQSQPRDCVKTNGKNALPILLLEDNDSPKIWVLHYQGIWYVIIEWWLKYFTCLVRVAKTVKVMMNQAWPGHSIVDDSTHS